jgi:hypothetical protein
MSTNHYLFVTEISSLSQGKIVWQLLFIPADIAASESKWRCPLVVSRRRTEARKLEVNNVAMMNLIKMLV